MFEAIDSVLSSKSVPSHSISYKSFKTRIVPMQNSYCDHRNVDSVNIAGLCHLSFLKCCTIREISELKGWFQSR